jgi:site-specific recombinase XerD
MKEIIEKFIENQRHRSGNRSTAKHYMSDLRLFTRHVGDKAIAHITVADIDSFVGQQHEQGLRAATINRRLATLQALFAYWASEAPDEPRPSPVNWRRHGVKKGEPLPRDASDAVVAQLLTGIQDVRDRAMFGLMVGAGLRVGEVIELRLEHLEQPPDLTQPARLLVCGKGEKERIVWLTAQWRNLVAAWLAVRPASDSDHLFLNQHQRPLSVAGVEFRLRTYCQALGLHLTCHQLRHTFARRLAEQRMPLASISQLLGHSQVTTTQRYTNGANPDLRDAFLTAMNALEEQSPVAGDNLALTPAPAAAPVAVSPTTAAPTLSSAPARSRSTMTADANDLTLATAHFDAQPVWLRPFLVTYLHHRWYQWQPHLAATHAQRLARLLNRIWTALCQQNTLTAWTDLQRSHLESWLHSRAAAGLAVSTRRHELTELLACLRFVSQQGVSLAPNLFQVAYPQRTRPLPKHLTEAEFQALLATVLDQTTSGSTRALLDRAWFLLLGHTGLRLSELLNLRLADVDLAGRRLFVFGSKNGDDRLLYLTPAACQSLAAYLAQRPPSDDDHLWLDHTQPLLDHQVRYRLRGWANVAGLTVSPHRLRHTFATRLVNQGLPLETIARLLGHRSLTMTQLYAHLYDHTVKEQFSDAMARIEGIATLEWPTATSDYTLHNVTVSDLSDSV